MDFPRVTGRKDLHLWRTHHQEPPKYSITRRYPQRGGPKTLPKVSESLTQRYLKWFMEYCNMSSLHGLKYVGETDISLGERVFWLCAFLVAAAIAAFFICLLFINYSNSPVTISFNPAMLNVQQIPFPSITICNMNVVLKSRALRIYAEGNKEQRSVLDDLCDNRNTSTDKSTISDIPWTTMVNTIQSATQLCHEMVLACKWSGQVRNCRGLINPTISDDGFCCTFNRLPVSFTQRDDTQTLNMSYPEDIIDWSPEEGYPVDGGSETYPYRAYGRGVDQGLTLVLDANLDEYFCSVTNSLGFKAILATPSEAPKVADLGFLISPGVEMRVAIDAQLNDAADAVKAIEWEKRKCFFSNERRLKFYKRYSSRNCFRECEANFTLKVCGCTAFDMPRALNTKVCSSSDKQCYQEARFEIERIGPNKSICNCLPGCFEVLYHPGAVTVGKLSRNLHLINADFMLNNISTEYFAANVAIVHFFYTVDQFQRRTKNALYGFTEFLSNTGGLLGLFMGFSFLTVVELVYFFFIQDTCKWGASKWNQRKRNAKIDQNKQIHFVH